jgi:hypothetical protein
MRTNSHLYQSFFLLAVLLLIGCTGSKTGATEEQMIGMMDLPSYHVEDSSGTLILPVVDIIVNYQSGEIEYLAVEAPLSGFELDIRTAPYHSNQVILIPRQLANLEREKKRFTLQVGVQELVEAPRISPLAAANPSSWRDVVERYWKPYTDVREQ